MTEVQRAIDPVCGMTVDPARAAGQTEYKGQTYYFCAQSCLKRFTADPESFLTGPATSDEGHQHHHHDAPAAPVAVVKRRPSTPLPPAAPGTQYVCPMDPDIRQSAPGACPRCGMALEPDVPIAAAIRVEYTCPMHPEIVRDAPGSCPICGMALEPRTVTLEDAAEPRADGHDAAHVDRRAARAAGLGSGDGRHDPRHGPGRPRQHAGGELDGAGILDAGRVLGRLAVARARLGVDHESPRQHVHADRAGRRSGLPVQRSRHDRAAICFPTVFASTAWSRPISTRPS